MGKVISWLVGGATLPMWKLVVAGVAATLLSALLSGGVSGVVLYNAGWRNATNAQAAATLDAQKKHTAWLREAAAMAGNSAADDATAELSNEQLEGVIIHAIASRPSTPGECLPDDFLRTAASLR